MKKLIYLIVAISFSAHSQSYTVIHTIGKIYDETTSTYLKKGSKISDQSSLKFETDGARAAALSSNRGRFVIQQAVSEASSNDIAYALSSVISPVRGRLSTRAGAINNKLDFQKFFEKGTIALIADNYQIDVSSTAFPINDSKFFYAQYALGGETINKKLGGSDGTITIDVDNFYSVDGKSIDDSQVKDIKLFYYDADKGSATMISEMNMVRVPRSEMEALAAEFDSDNEGLLEVLGALYGRATQQDLDNFRASK